MSAAAAHGAQRRVDKLPPFGRLASGETLLQLLIAFVGFQLLSAAVRKHLWHSYEPFKRYRLRNLSVCFMHSSFVGLWVVAFFVTHVHVMFTDPIFYYQPWMKIVLIVTVAYFIHDTTDMLHYELSRWTIELLFHHLATAFAMVIAICGETFVVFAYWALLMEFNSIFLHARTLFTLSGARRKDPKTYEIIKYINLVTFVIFRFAVQAWQLHYVVTHRAEFHVFYLAVGVIGVIVFFITNSLLFFRILAADSMLGEFGKKHAAINRQVAAADARARLA